MYFLTLDHHGNIMSLRPLLHFPDPRLRLIAKPVTDFDQNLQTLIDDMFETMYEGNGIGLAANQINVQQRIIVLDISDDSSQPQCFINPEIKYKDGIEESTEGCLSVPNIYETVERAKRIQIEAYDRQGKLKQLETDGLLAICLQHEIDHLDGKLFVDYLSPLKRKFIQKKIEKLRRETI